ncbi:MAG: hypothetical protein ACREIA_10815 [Opitutaceae bacterium]
MSRSALLRLLDLLPDLAHWEAVTGEWKLRLGATAMDVFPSGWLVKTRRVADWIPCQIRPSCRRFHNIEERSDGKLIAYAVDNEIECQPFLARHEDRVLWRFELVAFAHEIAETLSIEPAFEILRTHAHLSRLGTIGRTFTPCYLCLPKNAADLLSCAETVAAKSPSSFALVFPHARVLRQDVRDLVHAKRSHVIALADWLALDGRRRLSATRELAEIDPNFGRDVARAGRKFAVPPGTPWSQIVVHATNRVEIKVTLKSGGAFEMFSRDVLRMTHGKTGEARLAWEFFLLLVNSRGRIDRMPNDRKVRDDLANRVRDLNRMLRDILSNPPPGNPIRASRRKNDEGYRCRFALTSDF